jgi:hypothetical protein
MVAPSHPPPGPKPRTLDVRALIARGEEPFPHVMALVRSTPPGEEFVLITPFIPAPLIEKLQGEGYAIRPEYRTDGSWQTHFVKPKG